MKIPDKWWTTPTESLTGKKIIVTGRDCMEPFIEKGKYAVRVNVSWHYSPLSDGMPDDKDGELLGEITDALHSTFDRDGVALLTGIYTGDGIRDWVFYTKNLRTFGTVFNCAMEPFPQLDLSFEATEDPGWEEYLEMRNLTFIPEAD